MRSCIFPECTNGDTSNAAFRACKRCTIIGVDYGKGQMSAEVEGRRLPGGKIELTAVRVWSHELELQAEPHTFERKAETQ